MVFAVHKVKQAVIQIAAILLWERRVVTALAVQISITALTECVVLAVNSVVVALVILQEIVAMGIIIVRVIAALMVNAPLATTVATMVAVYTCKLDNK